MMGNGVEVIGVNLPEELIPEILVRLPVKSLLKFRCVSKSWRSLISSDQFAKAHPKISTNNNAYLHDSLIFGSTALPTNLYTCSISSVSNLADLIYSVNDDYVQLDSPFIRRDEYRFLVGSCNGLVCLSLSGHVIILWNPITRESNELPGSDTHILLNYEIAYTNHGFGYDEVGDDYKVVEFNYITTYGVSHVEVNVYSRRSNSWKVLANWPGGDASSWPGQFLNGAIHWSVCRSREWFIVSQDLASDVFVELPLPNFDHNGIIESNVRIIEGCLALCCGYNTCMDVWVMKESWIKVVCIPYFLDLRGSGFAGPCPVLFLGQDINGVRVEFENI